MAKGIRARKEKKLLEVIDQNRAEIAGIGQKIWELRELSQEEEKSAALLAGSLASHGFAIKKGLVGLNPDTKADLPLPTAFTATFEALTGGPHIGVMLEYDALPNGHSCGHNLIAEAGYGAALALGEILKTVPGKLQVFGTPAEETIGAKIYLLAAGYMDGVDVMFTAHPGQFWSAELKAKAMIGTLYERGLVFSGKAAHASNAPEKGRSAFDAAMLMGMGLEFLREHIPASDRIHYGITKGGMPCNIIPDRAEAHICLRSDTVGSLEDLQKRVENVIRGAALMTDTKAEYDWYPAWLNAVEAPELWRLAAQAADDLGVDGQLFQSDKKASVSTDAGNVGSHIPVANLWFPVAPSDPPELHSDEFAQAAAGEYAGDNAILAAKIIALSAYRLLSDPQSLRTVKDDFWQNKNTADDKKAAPAATN